MGTAKKGDDNNDHDDPQVYQLCERQGRHCVPSSDFKYKLHDALNTLLRRAKSSDIVEVLGGLNTELGRLSESDTQLGGRLGLDLVSMDNGERAFKYALITDSLEYSRNLRIKVHWIPILREWESGALHKAVCGRVTGPLALFNFVTNGTRTLESVQNPDVQMVANDNLVDLEYADDTDAVFE
ncbi:hypothetical protein CLF_103203 [Clonorchis sinensis]|uniref:Uncharacterized protein n=1 Tax=Clonorchis sinensis TaxID=79923 RepID=G7Y994_CLOSI|nr:hypothetical protein CLF_103203 [Clonorchis sinensis]